MSDIYVLQVLSRKPFLGSAMATLDFVQCQYPKQKTILFYLFK